MLLALICNRPATRPISRVTLLIIISVVFLVRLRDGARPLSISPACATLDSMPLPILMLVLVLDVLNVALGIHELLVVSSMALGTFDFASWYLQIPDGSVLIMLILRLCSLLAVLGKLLLAHEEGGDAVPTEFAAIYFEVLNHPIHPLIQIALHLPHDLLPQNLFINCVIATLECCLLLFLHDNLNS